MNKQEVYEYLKNKNVLHEITEHGAVFSMSELDETPLPYPEYDAKNLFVRDDKRRNFYLITVRGDKRVNLKEFRKKYETRVLSFAYPEELEEKTGLLPGSVSPFGLLNNKDADVIFCLDREFMDDRAIIGIHPNENTATVWLKTEDLIEMIKNHGNEVRLVEL